MGKSKRPTLSVDEQNILEHLQVRLVLDPGERARLDQLIRTHHYLHDATLVGESLRYVASYQGQWLAVATWSGAAFHLKARDEFIGWTFEQCRRRRALLANNSRLLVLPECHSPNLISRFMKLMLARLAQDWNQRWGHPIVLVETFVDPQLYQGTAYKVSGWSHLGRTAGWKRDAADFYQKHDAPKQIWVRELSGRACVKLRAEQLPAEWAAVEASVAPRCTESMAQIGSLMELARAQVPEFRRDQALAYPIPGMVCLIVMAMAVGVVLGPDDLAQFADTLSQAQLRSLGFRMDGHTRRWRCPKKTCFQRVLRQVDAAALERVLLLWQRRLLGPVQDQLVVVDGKKMRHAGVEMVNVSDGAGHYLGGRITPDKTNEIPVARQVLGRLDLRGKIVLADALHTNPQTAQQILYEQGADYLLTVKGNQPTLQETLAHLFTPQALSPSAHGAHAGHHPGAQSEPPGDPLPAVRRSHPQPGGLSGGSPGRPPGNPGQAGREMDPRSGLSLEQPDPGATPSRRHAPTQTILLGH